MKTILLIAGLISLLSTTGCIVPGGDRHGHARYERHDEVIGPPVVVVRAPEVVVRPPEIIVR